MALDTNGPRSRRALPGAGLGAPAATVAGAIGRPAATNAATDYVALGGIDHATNTTLIHAAGGTSAIAGQSDSGVGLYGVSASGTAVLGATNGGTGQTAVFGQSIPHAYAVKGQTENGIGVFAQATGG
jgi:hypothetical protein